MKANEDLIVSRTYQKDDQLQSLYIREVSGGEIDGSIFQLETWKNNVEDAVLRVASGDIYHVRSKYFGKLLDLMEEGWKRTNVGVHGNRHRNLFDPAAL